MWDRGRLEEWGGLEMEGGRRSWKNCMGDVGVVI